MSVLETDIVDTQFEINPFDSIRIQVVILGIFVVFCFF